MNVKFKMEKVIIITLLQLYISGTRCKVPNRFMYLSLFHFKPVILNRYFQSVSKDKSH